MEAEFAGYLNLLRNFLVLTVFLVGSLHAQETSQCSLHLARAKELLGLPVNRDFVERHITQSLTYIFEPDSPSFLILAAQTREMEGNVWSPIQVAKVSLVEGASSEWTTTLDPNRVDEERRHGYIVNGVRVSEGIVHIITRHGLPTQICNDSANPAFSSFGMEFTEIRSAVCRTTIGFDSQLDLATGRWLNPSVEKDTVTLGLSGLYTELTLSSSHDKRTLTVWHERRQLSPLWTKHFPEEIIMDMLIVRGRKVPNSYQRSFDTVYARLKNDTTQEVTVRIFDGLTGEHLRPLDGELDFPARRSGVLRQWWSRTSPP